MHVNYKVALAKTICQRLNKGTLPSSYAEIIPCATETVDLQHPLREFKVEWGTLLQGSWWDRSLES